MPTAATPTFICWTVTPDPCAAPYAGAMPPLIVCEQTDCRAAGGRFFKLADIAGTVHDGKPAHDLPPIALEAVKRIDAILDI
jgi:transposase